jgi:D-serine deaminase-like pyridoxal phosphate-dependent protein
VEDARDLVAKIKSSAHLEFRGFYTHEGHAYTCPPGEIPALANSIHDQISQWRDAIAPGAPIWPGCSVTAAHMATLPRVQAIRPGAYVFGDLFLSEVTQVMPWEHLALTVLVTVIDRPERGVALIDAGSKVFSSDKTTAGDFARSYDRRDIAVVRCSEEHGFLRGDDVDSLQIGQRLRLVPAHVCTCINLADTVCVIEGDTVTTRWKIDARGKVQ